jgi:hypothetical protein
MSDLKALDGVDGMASVPIIANTTITLSRLSQPSARLSSTKTLLHVRLEPYTPLWVAFFAGGLYHVVPTWQKIIDRLGWKEESSSLLSRRTVRARRYPASASQHLQVYHNGIRSCLALLPFFFVASLSITWLFAELIHCPLSIGIEVLTYPLSLRPKPSFRRLVFYGRTYDGPPPNGTDAPKRAGT